MGLFDFLFGGRAQSSVEVLDDQIWKSSEARFDAIRNHLQAPTDAVVTLLIGHFDDTLVRLQDAAEGSDDAQVQATLAENLSVDIAGRLNLEADATIELIIAERHPLLSVDQQVLGFGEEVPCRCRVSYYLSLEDALLRQFVGESVTKLLDSLGMRDDEAITGGMLSRRIRAAQQKLEKMAFGNTRAASAAEWIEVNVP